MIDIIKYVKNELLLSQVRGIYYTKNNNFQKTQNVNPSFYPPELDLLNETLSNRGAMQLETTRGCFFSCSFCPREHKGKWRKIEPLSNFYMQSLSNIFSQHMQISKKIFIVDEEFIGYEKKSDKRILELSKKMKKYNFSFESSSRIDQVVRIEKNKNWHINRLSLWRALLDNGLEKMLFGVESGVDSILNRFNKKISVQQIIYAVRLLTAIGVPIRLTYIMFDPLMNVSELFESYLFLNRKDLILPKDDKSTLESIFDYIQNDNYCNKINLGIPLYRRVPYLLSSLICFEGSEYYFTLKRENLVTGNMTSMGKTKSLYLDNKIGLFSHYAQLWIDRHFSIDYTLKSITKTVEKKYLNDIYNLRNIIKDSSINLLYDFLKMYKSEYQNISDESLISLLQKNNEKLVKEFLDKYKSIYLPEDIQINEKIDIWKNQSKWTLINED